jgi:D-amino-acid oxidase
MSIEIRKIIPPDLSSAHLGQKILCHRSMRLGSPKLNVEIIQNKIVANNYGHGGSGWTIGYGCAQYVNDLFIKSDSLKFSTPITIVGAGVIGLFSAYDLYKKGYHNLTIIADQFKYLVSHNAGGLLAPVSMSNDPEIHNLINKLGIDAYRFYDAIARGAHEDFRAGASITASYFKSRESSGLEPYVNVVMQAAKDVMLDFGNSTTQKMVAYDDGIFIDTSLLMQELNKYLENKVIFIKQKISSFSEIKTNYIVNCSGMGAMRLNDDKKLISVQGHLIMLKNQRPQNIDHMIFSYLDEDSSNKYTQQTKRAFYISPKRLANSSQNDVGVIGGTFIKDANYKTPNTEEFERLVINSRKFYGLT